MSYTAIRIEGNIVSPDIIALLDGDDAVAGQRSADYGLPAGTKVKDEIARSWAEAQEAYRRFKRRIGMLRAHESVTTLTRDAYMVPLFSFMGYELDAQRSGLAVSGQAQTYPISHIVRNRADTPLSIIGYHDAAGLDKKPSNATRRMSAHALLQEFLNLSEALYGIVTNGHVIRLLRDSSRLVKQTYIEFDLDRIFEENLYAEYAVLYRLLHASRLPANAARPMDCLLERYHQDSLAAGARIRDGLAQAVEAAIVGFGNGFLQHPANTALRSALDSGDLTPGQYYHLLLRLIYRMLFLMVIEERNLLFARSEDPATQQRTTQQRAIYTRGYGLQRLRGLAEKFLEGSDRHTDLWLSLRATFGLFEATGNGHTLGIVPLAGDLFHPTAIGILAECQLSNQALLRCVLHLSRYTPPKGVPMRVNYAALNVEEFGSVYEGLLGYTPHISAQNGTATFSFRELQGNERKTSGSYYTPDSLVQAVLDSALNPVIAQAQQGKKPAAAAAALRALRICEPAVGSGHFLLGAARRLADAIARADAEAQGMSEYAPTDYQNALRDVIEHCLYGVDINPMSAELCRVALWIESHTPGKPLSFLDHHIQVGNSLLGTTPALILDGIPDDAYAALNGDDKATVAALKKRNKAERRPLGPLFTAQDAQQREALRSQAELLNAIATDDLQGVQTKRQRYREYLESAAYHQQKLVADTWCAAFVLPKIPVAAAFGAQAEGVTSATVQQLLQGGTLPAAQAAAVTAIAAQYQFFHWHVAFPDVMAQGGFACVLGNPPWERVKLQEKEWFALRHPAIAEAANAATRRRLIDALATDNPPLFAAFHAAVRTAEGESHFLRSSGKYPLCGRGDVNLYTVFTETMHTLLRPDGVMGCIIPSGIATDDTTKYFFGAIAGANHLVTLYDFENKNIFDGVHKSFKFCLFTARGAGSTHTAPAEYIFFAQSTADIHEDERRFTLSADDIALLNPNSQNCAVFRSRRDAELTKAIYRRVPVLWREQTDTGPEQNPWGIRFSRLFDMSNDSHLFRTRSQLAAAGWELTGNVFVRGPERYLPLYEAKMVHHYDHRWATYVDDDETRDLTAAEKRDPHHSVLPRYWVPEGDVTTELQRIGWQQEWLLGWRDITNVTNERTLIAGIVARSGAGNKFPLIFSDRTNDLAYVTAQSSTFIADYVSRQKMGGTTLNFFIVKQLPFLPPETFAEKRPFLPDTVGAYVLPRVLELTYTAWDLQPFARDCGYDGPPFVWDEERRFALRCELDALFLHLYLPSDASGAWQRHPNESDAAHAALVAAFATPRAAAEHVLDSFHVVRLRDEKAYGSFRTKERVLAAYDAMARYEV